MPTSLLEISKKAESWRRKRVLLKSPVLKNGTPGSVRGASGNRRPYRDGAEGAGELPRQGGTITLPPDHCGAWWRFPGVAKAWR